jgi:hypothetical protein
VRLPPVSFPDTPIAYHSPVLTTSILHCRQPSLSAPSPPCTRAVDLLTHLRAEEAGLLSLAWTSCLLESSQLKILPRAAPREAGGRIWPVDGELTRFKGGVAGAADLAGGRSPPLTAASSDAPVRAPPRTAVSSSVPPRTTARRCGHPGVRGKPREGLCSLHNRKRSSHSFPWM